MILGCVALLIVRISLNSKNTCISKGCAADGLSFGKVGMGFMFLKEYISNVFGAVKSLTKGMKTTGGYFVRPKEIITQQYPDNRDTLVLPERFRGEVVMPHDENNEHACTGCTACELACPNATIKIITKFDISPEGKKKKALDTFVYHLELCTMCNLCVQACPTDAIKMAQNFEHSVYDRRKLTKVLNHPGSKIREGIE